MRVMDSGSQIPPIPSSNIFPLNNESSRPSSSVSENESVASGLPAPGIIRDESKHLDVQYLEIVSDFQSLLERFRHSVYVESSPSESNVFSLLQIAFVDLRVWAYDLSSDVDSVLSGLRNLSSDSSELKRKLQQIMRDIGQSLELIKEEADRTDRNKSRYGRPLH